MSWTIGDKILCINDTNWKMDHFGFIKPKCGEVYTIRGMFDIVNSNDHGILLEEIVNYNVEIAPNVIREPIFYDWRFVKWNPEEIELEDRIVEKIEELLETEAGMDLLLDFVNE